MESREEALRHVLSNPQITRHDFYVGCSLIGYLSRTDDLFSVQAADAIEQADEVLRQLEGHESES